jgi:small subunit ribosomal protein S1
MSDNRYCIEGALLHSVQNKEYTQSLSALERAYTQGLILEGIAVLCDSDLSLWVDLNGIRGKIPKEEIAYCQNGESVKDIAAITRVGKAVCFKITAITQDENGEVLLLLSRRLAQIECLNEYLFSLSAGDIIDARVTHMEQFGAFVDVGCGWISLLSIDCISVSRISHPHDRLEVGQVLKVAVKSIDYETGRIYVTQKELLGTWEENASLFSIGQTVAGVVRSIEEYGIFVELTPNLAGLAEYRPDVTVGQICAVYIKNIIPERMKVKLVLIDSYKGELGARHLTQPNVGLLHADVSHISEWQYSPTVCEKKIQTCFSA